MITGYVIIRNQTIVHNGVRIFDAKSSLDDFLLRAYGFLKMDYPKYYKMDNLSRLGILAAEVLLEGRSIAGGYDPRSVAVVLSNAHASLDTDLKYAATAGKLGSPSLFVYTLPNIVAGEICIRHRITGENAFFVSSEFDPQLLVDYIDMVMAGHDPAARACLAGWIDVMGEHHDVFLYLTEKSSSASLMHTAEQLKKIYNSAIWNS